MTPIAIIQYNAEAVSEFPGILGAGGDFYVGQTYYFLKDALSGLRKDPVDIVVVDINSQGDRGIEWMKELKNRNPATKWMIYALFDNEEFIIHALQAGADAYILKNGSTDHLRNALLELSGGGTPMSPCIMGKILSYFHHLPYRENHDDILSDREKEILHLTSRGLLNKEIGQHLGIQRETVKKHLSRIYEKLQVQNKIEALNKFYVQKQA